MVERAQTRHALQKLKENEFIEIRKRGETIMYRLTDKGRIAALKDSVRLADKRKDGKMILVSFDIPEQERLVRGRLRYFLKDLKFERIQQSLWGIDLDVGKIISRAIADIKADKWVRVFESREIKKKFPF